MKIKFVLKKSIVIFFPIFFVILIMMSFYILKIDYRFGHKNIFFYPKSLDWLSYHLELKYHKFKNNFFPQKKGLPQVHIFLSEKNSEKLLDDPPFSSKEYVKAQIIIDDKVKDIFLKYKGSNPFNWLFDQKEIRVKYSKKKTKNNRRYYDFRSSQNEILNDYVFFKLANKILSLSYDTKLVELFVNKVSKGIYIERGVLRETFLRRNKLMPVNSYRGEQLRFDDKLIGLEGNLFNNAYLWKKTSYQNSINEDDYSDLKTFLDKIRKSSTDTETLSTLLQNGNLETFSSLSALQVLLQSEVNDNYHNQRLIFDPWSGKTHILAHDATYNNKPNNNFIKLNFINNDLMENLILNNQFVLSNYNKIYYLINEKKIFEALINDLNLIKDDFLISYERDIGKIQRKYFLPNEKHVENFSPDQLINSLNLRKKKINEKLNKNTNASWQKTVQGFDIKVNDILPLSNLEINFEENAPKYIVYDIDYNQRIDQNDIYFFPDENGKFILDIKLFSNRIVKYHSQIENSPDEKSLNILNTKFGFLIDNNIYPKNIFSFNLFTKKKFEIKKNDSTAILPAQFNIPIINIKNEKIILEGNIDFNKNTIYENPVEVKEGTVINLCEKCSLIFKNKVQINGHKNKPVIVKGLDNKKWGSIGILGQNTKGSKLHNLRIEGGSGAKVDGVYFYAALSINDTSNIDISGLLMKNNYDYDDMLHIIYSNNINIDNSKFVNSYLDTIDIDVSNRIKLANIEIINSGNDGIDFMETDSELRNITIKNSKDKGLSVGENSKIELFDSLIKNNNYGIVAKDSSVAYVKTSQILDNEIQLGVYKKNWRYGGSGKIDLENIELNKNKNIFLKDKKGKIQFSSENFYKNIILNEIKEFSLN